VSTGARPATGAARVEAVIRAANAGGRPAIAAFLTAGFPSRDGFADVVRPVAAVADVLELGVPFSDPMADGVTIREASRRALEGGVTLDWILELVAGLELETPVVLMSYLNPLLSRPHERLAEEAAAAGVAGFIVPDLPLEESEPLCDALAPAGLALVQLVTPLTPPRRRKRLAGASAGFLYAVTRAGTTGAGRGDARTGLSSALEAYLREVRTVSPRPVLAGFGIRSPEQVAGLGGLVDGVIVGSALIERLADDRDPVELLRELRDASTPEPRGTS